MNKETSSGKQVSKPFGDNFSIDQYSRNMNSIGFDYNFKIYE